MTDHLPLSSPTGGPPVEPGQHVGRSLASRAFVYVFLFGLYTGIDLRVGGAVLVPYVVCGLAGSYFLIWFLPRIRTADILLFAGLFAITLLTVFLSPQPRTFLVERLKGFAQLVYSVTVSFAVFSHLRSTWTRSALARLFGWCAVIIIVGTALETYGGLQPVSDAFRKLVFDPSFLYFANRRDLRVFGQIRPKFFTKEPAHVALFFLLSAFVWYAMSDHPQRRWRFVAAVGTAFFFVRSPIILIAIPLAILIEVFLRPKLGGGTLHTSPARFGAFFVVAIAGLVLAFQTILRSRLELVLSGGELSTLVRIVVPALLSVYVIQHYPLVGAGITGKEFIVGDLSKVFRGFGFLIHDPNAMVSAPFLFLIYYGLGAGLMMILVLVGIARRNGTTHLPFVLPAVVGLTIGSGAFVGMRVWFFGFAALLVANRTFLPTAGSQHDRLYSPHVSHNTDYGATL